MTNNKCDNCNHTMISRKDFYECPICHYKKEKDALENQNVKRNYKNDLLDYIDRCIDNKTVLSDLVKNVLIENPKDEIALLFYSYLEKNTKPDAYKREIGNFFTSEKENINFEPIFKYLVNNSDYKFLTILEKIMHDIILSDDCKIGLQSKKKEIEELIERTSIINSDVFVCYSSNDLQIVDSIVRIIEDEGFSCWYADRNLAKNHPTDFDYKKNIESAINNCKVFLVIASKNSMYSNDVQWEIDIAKAVCEKRVEYLISSIKHTPKFRDFFDGLQWIDATKSDETRVLIERIHYLINGKVFEIEINNDHCLVENGDYDIYQDDPVVDYSKELQNSIEIDEESSNKKIKTDIKKELDSKELGIKAFECKDYEEALSRFQLCDQDSEVNYYLGRICIEQHENRLNLDDGYYYFMKSDDPRLYEEANELGKKFYTGNGCSIDLCKAFNCFIKSAELGNDKAMCNVAMCYKNGNGVEKNLNQAFIYYKKAADKGNVKAMYEFGNICLDDVNTLKEGILYLTKAANAGLADAQYSLGVCYYKGYGVTTNYSESLKWIQKAISGGSKQAQEYKNTNFYNDIAYDNRNCALELDDLEDLDI